MIFGNSNVMKFGSIQISQSSGNTIPRFEWCLFFSSVLSRAFRTNIIEDGLLNFQMYPGIFPLGFFWLFFFLFENISLKSTVIATKSSAISIRKSVTVVSKVILKFFLEFHLRRCIRNFCFFAIVLIHFPSNFKSYTIIFFKDMIIVDYKVVKVIRCAHHLDRNIIIVIIRIVQIYIQTFISNSAKLKLYLLCSCLIIFST